MSKAVKPISEKQLTLFVDLLGFSEVSRGADNSRRLEILDLLTSIAELRRDFYAQTEKNTLGSSIKFAPAISTFSDHIVISYPLGTTSSQLGLEEGIATSVIMHHSNELLAQIAAAALRIGFLIRGGASVGSLYHSQGVVFGEALVDAYEVESRISVYPRVVLSNSVFQGRKWVEGETQIIRGNDGLCYFNYFQMLLLDGVTPGPDYRIELKKSLIGIVDIVQKNMIRLEGLGKQKELAIWIWFAQEFRKRIDFQFLEAFDVPLDIISWPILGK